MHFACKCPKCGIFEESTPQKAQAVQQFALHMTMPSTLDVNSQPADLCEMCACTLNMCQCKHFPRGVAPTMLNITAYNAATSDDKRQKQTHTHTNCMHYAQHKFTFVSVSLAHTRM